MRIFKEYSGNDVLTNAVESGAISYWAEIEDLKRDEELNVVSLTICECDIDGNAEPNGVRKTLTSKEIDEARMRIICEGGTSTLEINKQICMDVDQENNDANTDDCIVQIAMFGEIVYG